MKEVERVRDKRTRVVIRKAKEGREAEDDHQGKRWKGGGVSKNGEGGWRGRVQQQVT